MMIEKQKFTQGWIWIGLLMGVIITSYIIGIAIKKNEDLIWMVYLGLIALIVFSIFFLFAIARLSLVIDDKGIAFQFFPFQLHEKQINWEEIKTASITKFDPIYDFKGWGVRKGRNEEVAYIVNGNKGLKLVLHNNKTIIIGIKDENIIQDYLDRHFRSLG